MNPPSIYFGPSSMYADNLFILDVARHRLLIADSQTLYSGLGDSIYAISVYNL